jgi:hypothetical protein
VNSLALGIGQIFKSLNSVHRSNLELDKESEGGRTLISLNFLNNPDAVKIIEEPQPKQIHDAAE